MQKNLFTKYFKKGSFTVDVYTGAALGLIYDYAKYSKEHSIYIALPFVLFRIEVYGKK